MIGWYDEERGRKNKKIPLQITWHNVKVHQFLDLSSAQMAIDSIQRLGWPLWWLALPESP